MPDANVQPMIEPDFEQMLRHLDHLFGGDLDGCHDGKIELAWCDGKDGRLRHAAIFGTDEIDELIERAVRENRLPGQNVYIGQALRKPDIAPFGRGTGRPDVLRPPWSSPAGNRIPGRNCCGAWRSPSATPISAGSRTWRWRTRSAAIAPWSTRAACCAWAARSPGRPSPAVSSSAPSFICSMTTAPGSTSPASWPRRFRRARPRHRRQQRKPRIARNLPQRRSLASRSARSSTASWSRIASPPSAPAITGTTTWCASPATGSPAAGPTRRSSPPLRR